jgi:hypothetical protein
MMAKKLTGAGDAAASEYIRYTLRVPAKEFDFETLVEFLCSFGHAVKVETPGAVDVPNGGLILTLIN